eukprot:GHVL01041576.1.p1 GENE.GHVL01041576.1~~GHVL01041576.1.p1  ORF type:complete len:140 (-),score=23.87 GHVL01041576.1:182-601(-)
MKNRPLEVADEEANKLSCSPPPNLSKSGFCIVIDDSKIDFIFTEYHQRWVVILTDNGLINSWMEVQIEGISSDSKMNLTSVDVLFGNRNDTSLQLYAKHLGQLIIKKSGILKTVLIGISIKNSSNTYFKRVMNAIENNI